MVYLYSKCKLLIGTRLHSCILAAVAKTPVIAIRYQGYKTQGVMKMLGSSKYVLDIYNLNGQELFGHILEIIANHQKVQKAIAEKVTLMRNHIELEINLL